MRVNTAKTERGGNTAIEVKSSDAFAVFVKFAQGAMVSGNAKAVARMDGIAGRSISAADNDKVGRLTRFNEAKFDNDFVRALFFKAVCDMFGGEANLLDGVRTDAATMQSLLPKSKRGLPRV